MHFPSARGVPIDSIPAKYGIVDFHQALAEFILTVIHPKLSLHQIRTLAPRFKIPFNTVSVFFKIKFWNPDAQGHEDIPETLDCVHVRPAHQDSKGRAIPEHFDTVLVKGAGAQESGVEGTLNSINVIVHHRLLNINYQVIV